MQLSVFLVRVSALPQQKLSCQDPDRTPDKMPSTCAKHDMAGRLRANRGADRRGAKRARCCLEHLEKAVLVFDSDQGTGYRNEDSWPALTKSESP
jgi:hypothetical protein